MTYDCKYVVGLYESLGVGEALCCVEAVIIVDELDALALKAACVVVFLECGLHACIEGNTDGRVVTGGCCGIAYEDGVLGYALYIDEGCVAVALYIFTALSIVGETAGCECEYECENKQDGN